MTITDWLWLLFVIFGWFGWAAFVWERHQCIELRDELTRLNERIRHYRLSATAQHPSVEDYPQT